LIEKLKELWKKYAPDAPEKATALNTLFFELCTAYSESHRHYHTLAHINAMLSLLEQMGCLNKFNFWATWFHDVIYNPLATDNEDRSADIAKSWLGTLDCEIEVIKKAVALIKATKSHSSDIPLTEEDQAFLDADMSILGADIETYDRYSANIRKEFYGVPDDSYREGRIKFLSNTLALKKIFYLNIFSREFESQARINIRREIDSLS